MGRPGIHREVGRKERRLHGLACHGVRVAPSGVDDGLKRAPAKGLLLWQELGHDLGTPPVDGVRVALPRKHQEQVQKGARIAASVLQQSLLHASSADVLERILVLVHGSVRTPLGEQSYPRSVFVRLAQRVSQVAKETVTISHQN